MQLEKTYKNCKVVLEQLEGERVAITFTQIEEYGQTSIRYEDEHILYLMMNLRTIYDDETFPSDRIFWKAWFFEIKEDLLPMLELYQ